MKNIFLCLTKANVLQKTWGGDSPNQTDDTLTRQNRIGVMSGASRRQAEGNASLIIPSKLLQIWKYAACLLLAFFVGIGNVWGADDSFTIANPSANINTQDNVCITGEAVANAKMANVSNQKAFLVATTGNSNSAINIFSELTNIKSISFDVVRNTGSSSKGAGLDINVSTGGAFSIPTTGFTATNDGESMSSLSAIQIIGNNVSDKVTAITVSFSSPVKALVLMGNSSPCHVRNLEVVYDKGTAPQTIYFASMTSSANSANLSTKPADDASIVARTDVSSKTTIGDNTYYKMNGSFTITLGTGETFAIGDEIVFDISAGGARKNVGVVVDLTTDVTIKTYLCTTTAAKLIYIVKADDGIAGTNSVSFSRADANTLLYSVSVRRAGGGDDPDPEPTPTNYAVTHTLTNVKANSGATGATAATEGSAYNAVFAPSKVGYTLPSTIAVTIGDEDATEETDYTWNSSTGAFQVPAAKVTGNIVVTIAGVAPVKTFKSDYSDFTQVGETNAYYTYLAQEAYTSYAVAGWTSYENESFGSKKLKIDPATDEEISGSNANYGCLRSDRIMEYYLTGVTAVKFYVINGGSSGDPRVAKYTLNGGEETTLVSVAFSTSNTGTIELDPSTNNTIRIYASSDLHLGAMKVTLPDASCAATVPGNISKGTATGGTGTITLTAAGEIASGDTWYWQSAEDGTATNLGDGATKNVNAVGTYYIRAYNATGTCWSAAKSVEVEAADLLTAISPTLSYATSNIVVGNTSSPTLEGNAGSGSVSYALNDVSPAGSLTINSETGVVTAVTVGGTATVTATIAANGGYAGNTATSGTITVVANPLGTHTLTWAMKVGKTTYSSLLDEPSSTSTYMTAGGTLNYGSSTTIDAGNKGAENRTIKVFGVATSTEEHGAESYVEFPFTITSGYTFTPTAVSVKVANVTTTKYYDLVLLNADGSQSVARATFESEKTDGSVETISWSSISGLTLRGSGKLRVYAFNRGETDGFRFGTPITITGTVAEYVAPVDYTVTINPNGGAYASTQTGWTYSEGVYTKTVTGGTSFSAPEGLEKGTDELSWKDGLDNVVTFPTTISGDITFIAQWTPYVESSNADLSALSVAGCTLNETFAKGTTAYTTNLPFGSSMPAVSAVTATKDDAKAADPVVSISGNVITVHCVAENGTTEKDYTITVTIADSKDIRMVWQTTGNPCGESSAPTAVVLSTDDAIKDYLSISFVQTTETASKQAEEKSGSYLSTGKSIGNLVKITAKPGYAFKNMSFYGKIETDEVKCPISIDGGETWTDVTGTVGSNAQHCDVFTNKEAHEIILKNNAGSGTWIRHMDITVIAKCTPKTIAWTAEPAAEYEVGASVDPIAASANNGTVSYASNDADVIAVNSSNGALTISALGTVTLSASVPAGDGVIYCDEAANVAKSSINTYFLVTFDKQNGESATLIKYYKNDAAIALPETPTYAGFDFQGWFDAETGGNEVTSAVTPTASRTIYAQWEAQCDGPTITTQPASANYFVGRTASALTCEATAGDEGELTYTWYSCDDAERTNPVALEGAPTPSTAAVGTSYYYCTVQEAGCDVVRTSDVAVITVTEKDMLRIIKIATTGGSNKTVTGYFAKAADCAVSLQSDSKFGTSSYMKMALDEEEFQAGDVLNVHITTVAGGGSIALYSTYNSDDALLYNSGVRGVVGDNKITLTDAIEGRSILYLCRTSNNAWNPYVDYIEVYRPFPQPLLTGMTIDGAVAVVDELDATVYNVTIPAGSNLASLDVVPTFLSNDPSLTNGAVSGSWAIGSNTYVVTDKDGDSKSYTINITRDAAVESVSVSGETIVAAKSQITLTATVLPAEVSNKAVTWSSSDETKATVDANGVVTGKAEGSVTITATSVADGTKKGTKEITVTKFVGTERVYWFAYADDAEANGVENNSEVFGSAPTGTTNGAQEITFEEGWVVNTTKKAGSSTLGSFTVPADFTATLYVVVKGSGSSGRYIQLKQSDVVKYTSEEFGSADPTVLKIDGVAAGTYTIANVGGLSNFYLYAAELNSYPLTSVALEEGFNLRLEQSRTPVFTITPAKAAVASQVWSVVSRTGASDATLNETTGEITAGAEEGTLTVKVTVTDAFGNEVESGNCVVKIVNIIDQKDVTGSMTWNWTGAATASVTINNEEALVLANYIDGDEWAYLKGTNGDQAYHHESSYGSYQGKGTLSFKTTVPGLVTITARRWSNTPDLKIGEDVILSLDGSNKTSKAYFVPAGEVNIIADATDGMRILKIEFDAEPTVDKIEGSHFGGYTREVNPQYYGTICLPKAGVMTGAMLFQVAYMDYKEDGSTPYKVYYDQVENGTMDAGMPYIFLAEQSTIGVYYTGTTEITAGNELDYHGLHGTLTDITEGMNGEGVYMLSNNKVLHSTNPASYLNANRAYIQISEIPGYNDPDYVAPAPKHRRISTGFNGANTATGVENIQSGAVQSAKVLINGKMYILRGEKMYDATGRLVK